MGAGKTTLLNEYLSSGVARDVAVLVNEFGAIDVDGAVINQTIGGGTKVMSLPNGCICCEVQEDLAEALLALVESGQSTTGILETTGLADPGAILRGAAHDPRLKRTIVIDSVVCVAGAPNIAAQLPEFPEAGVQVALADRIVISKSDLVSEDELSDTRDTVAKINPVAEIHERTAGHELGPIFESIDGRQNSVPPSDTHHHSHGIQTFTVDLPGPLDPDRFRDTLSFLIMRHAESLLRMKGVALFSGDSTPRLLNGVHDVFTSDALDGAVIENTGSLVFIGRGLPEEQIRSDLLGCVAP